MNTRSGRLHATASFKNPYSKDANKTYTLIMGGTDGGLLTGVLQPAPTPAFDHHGNSLAGRIIQPTDFAGINFGLATKGITPEISVSGARLSGQVKGFTAEWNNLSFSQGGQVTGSYNAKPGSTARRLSVSRSELAEADMADRVG
jgi:hypothetical protein